MNNTFKFKREENILNNVADDYQLSEKEIACLFDFYVIHSVFEGCYKRKDLSKDYGWDYITLQKKLNEIIDLENSFFSEKNNYGTIDFYDFSKERICILNKGKCNRIESFLIIVRHFLSHSCYHTIYFKNEKMILFQTNNKNNVTSRGIIKLQTLFKIANLISSKSEE